ncbi:ATP-binding protein [bacterium]|nr:ATP-binding protein [bacterium]
MEVAFGDRSVELSGEEPGPYAESERSAVDEFRRKFLYATRGIHFELLEADRVSPAGAEAELGYDRGRHSSRLERVLARQRRVERGGPYSSRIPVSEWSAPLSRRVAQFISEAQAYHRSFFQIEEPSLIRRLIEVITEDEEGVVEIGELRDRADQLRREDKRMSALGLASIRFSHEELENYIVKLGRWRKGERRERAEAVIRAYIEVLESRFAERASLASRLLTFEKVMANFLEGKVVTLAGRKGLVIKDALGGELRETQLSSGEQHLLYLMVAALVARREGTVIAIDEPELSMHLAWQRKLVPALFECSSGASPLFILATHSPDIAASYPNALVDIRNKKLARK